MLSDKTMVFWFFFCTSQLSHAQQTNILIVDGKKSILDLNPWLQVKTNNNFRALTDIIDTLKVQHSYTFECQIKNSTTEKIVYHLEMGSGSVLAEWISINDSVSHYQAESAVIEVGSEKEVKIQFHLWELDRMNSNRLSVRLLTPGDFHKQEANKLFQPFFLGIFLFMVFFNILYFLISRWVVYLKYAIYIFLSLIFFSHYFGFVQAIFPGLKFTSNNLVWILSSSIAASYTVFISDFGEFKKLNPQAYRIFKIVLIFKYIQVPTELSLWILNVDFIHSRPYLLTVMGFEVPLVLVGFYFLLISPFLRSKIILAASFILLSGSVVGQLNPFPNIDRMVIIEMGTLIEIMIFSISLALKAKEIDNNRILVSEQLLEKTRENIKIQERISADLEMQVKERTLSLENKNRENELLMAEIHHRVKNNLQIISSLINLKGRQSSQETNEVLQQLNHRVFSMGLVYEKLHKGMELNQIRLDEYITEISHHLALSFKEPKSTISLKLRCEPINLDPERALACGLIANELMTNAIKYAFTPNQQNAEINIELDQENNLVSFNVSDNGEQHKPTSDELVKSFGLHFVEQLVQTKLRGEWNLKTGNGFRVTIKFPIENGKQKN